MSMNFLSRHVANPQAIHMFGNGTESLIAQQSSPLIHIIKIQILFKVRFFTFHSVRAENEHKQKNENN